MITADLELDEVNTLIRALLYSTDFTIEGLVYTSSGVHWKATAKCRHCRDSLTNTRYPDTVYS